jgi:hypothetical protein
MKWWLLFVFDLGAFLCVVRAIVLGRALTVAQATGPASGADQRAWLASEKGGWIAAGCICAFAAFLAAIAPA